VKWGFAPEATAHTGFYTVEEQWPYWELRESNFVKLLVVLVLLKGQWPHGLLAFVIPLMEQAPFVPILTLDLVITVAQSIN